MFDPVFNTSLLGVICISGCRGSPCLGSSSVGFSNSSGGGGKSMSYGGNSRSATVGYTMRLGLPETLNDENVMSGLSVIVTPPDESLKIIRGCA